MLLSFLGMGVTSPPPPKFEGLKYVLTLKEQNKIKDFLDTNKDKLKYIDLLPVDSKERLELWNSIFDFLEREKINYLDFTQYILLLDKTREAMGDYQEEPQIREELIKEIKGKKKHS